MHKRMGTVFLLAIWVWVVTPGPSCSAQATDSMESVTGVLEVDCNIAGINLYLCPKDNYAPKETRVFLGLIKSVKHVCSRGEISVGATPLTPTAVPVGTYILLIPPDYVWEKEGPIEVTVLPGEKTYFLLKLFSSRADRPESDYGGGGGGGGGGGAR